MVDLVGRLTENDILQNVDFCKKIKILEEAQHSDRSADIVRPES